MQVNSIPKQLKPLTEVSIFHVRVPLEFLPLHFPIQLVANAFWEKDDKLNAWVPDIK